MVAEGVAGQRADAGVLGKHPQHRGPLAVADHRFEDLPGVDPVQDDRRGAQDVGGADPFGDRIQAGQERTRDEDDLGACGPVLRELVQGLADEEARIRRTDLEPLAPERLQLGCALARVLAVVVPVDGAAGSSGGRLALQPLSYPPVLLLPGRPVAGDELEPHEVEHALAVDQRLVDIAEGKVRGSVAGRLGGCHNAHRRLSPLVVWIRVA